MQKRLNIIGGGLAGSEAAWQAAKQGIDVTLYEMRPKKNTPAHQTTYLAELLCSNSLRSNDPDNPHGLLKEELRRLGSLLIQIADRNSIPAGSALAVNRSKFASEVTQALEMEKKITIYREEVTKIPEGPTIIATGPLTSDSLAKEIEELAGDDNLYFYDAIAPIIDGDSINNNKTFYSSRHNPDENDYLNCPFSRDEYYSFVNAIINGEKMGFKNFENPKYFEGCMPIEETARRGVDSLMFGPLRPVGLVDPKTDKRPFAALQLRREDKDGQMYNLVGCQTRLKQPAQREVFRLVPGLEEVEFFRYGSIHRNTFVNAPQFLKNTFECVKQQGLFFAGQISGVEGYVESISSGLLAGLMASCQLNGTLLEPPPITTATGALINYITSPPVTKSFQPMNINAGIFPPFEKRLKKKERKQYISKRALEDFDKWTTQLGSIITKKPQ